MRSTWKGSLACSVLNVPVKLYGATEEKSTVKFNQLSPWGTRVRQKKVAIDDTGAEVDISSDDISRGFEVSDDNYIVITDSDLEAVKIPSISSIEIIQFIKEDIDLRMSKKSFFLAPDKGGEKAFSLLIQAMVSTSRKAVAKITMREKEHMVLIQPFGDVLLLQTLFYPAELRSSAEIAIKPVALSKQEIELAENLLNSMTLPWDPAEYVDEYGMALTALIQDKVAGKVIAAPAQSPVATQVDLLSQLTASLEKVTKA